MNHLSLFKHRPSSLKEYREDILSRLPPLLPQEGEPVSVLEILAKNLSCYKAEDVYPEPGESLCSWLNGARKGDNPVELTLVVGESRGQYRVDRSKRRGGYGLMTTAATCDGVGGARAVMGLLRYSGLPLEQIAFNGVVDEWLIAADLADKCHLVVVGTGEVNIFAMFLHGLVKDMFFGDSFWPPEPSKLGDELEVVGLDIFKRDPGGRLGIQDYGAVVLLKNPWNPKFRLLWIAGLTGRATNAGCSEVASNWSRHLKATCATGVVYLEPRNLDFPLGQLEPKAWLVPGANGEPAWEKASARPEDPDEMSRHNLDQSKLHRDSSQPEDPGDPKHRDEPKKNQAIRLFIAYSHKDENLLKGLRTHLSLLQREGAVETWYDRKIAPGHEWQQEIDKNLERANIILLLVSADFIASDYCYEKEMKHALERHDSGQARVIPVIVRNVDWKQTPFAKLLALPKDGRPVVKWRDKDAAWQNVVDGIRKAAETVGAAERRTSVIDQERRNRIQIAPQIAREIGDSHEYDVIEN